MNQNPNPNPNEMGIPEQNGVPVPNPYWQRPNEWRPYIPPIKPELKETCTKRDLIYGGVFFLLSLLCVNFFFYGGCGIAFAVAAVGLFGTGLLYLLPNRKGGKGYMGFLSLVYVLCALSLVFSDSGLGTFLAIATMFVLSGIALMEFMDMRMKKAGTFAAILDWFRITVTLPLENLEAIFYAIFHKKKEDGTAEKRKIDSVLIGLACAVPVLAVVIPLLIGADGAFEGLMDKLSLNRGKETLVTFLFGTTVFVLTFAQRFASKFYEKVEPRETKERKGLDTLLLGTFLTVISLVYILYLVSQLAYFFNGFAGLLPKEFTVAQYARRGFFEMTAVCVINLGLLLFTLLGARKREDGKDPVVIRVFAVFLCIFSLVLIATAMSKMNLYIQSFGMTYLRILTSVFMVFLCVVFCTMWLWIFLRKIPYMKVVVITAVILVLGVSFADPAHVVADYNVKAYQTGKLDFIDMDELGYLGSHAVVPYAWELTKDSNAMVSDSAWEILYNHGRDFGFFEGEGEEYSYDWRSFNITSYKAYKLILEHREKIYSEACTRGYDSYDRFD